MQASNSSVENRLTLSGNVASHVKQNLSPAGIPHYSFWLEHRSKQIESGFERQAWCKIQVILSGKRFDTQTQYIKLGVKVKILGFIHTHKDFSGNSQLVLHTEQIEFID